MYMYISPLYLTESRRVNCACTRSTCDADAWVYRCRQERNSVRPQQCKQRHWFHRFQTPPSKASVARGGPWSRTCRCACANVCACERPARSDELVDGREGRQGRRRRWWRRRRQHPVFLVDDAALIIMLIEISTATKIGSATLRASTLGWIALQIGYRPSRVSTSD